MIRSTKLGEFTQVYRVEVGACKSIPREMTGYPVGDAGAGDTEAARAVVVMPLSIR